MEQDPTQQVDSHAACGHASVFSTQTLLDCGKTSTSTQCNLRHAQRERHGMQACTNNCAGLLRGKSIVYHIPRAHYIFGMHPENLSSTGRINKRLHGDRVIEWNAMLCVV